MASLAHAIRTFRSGALSPGEFLAQVDRVLANDQASPAQCLEMLKEENTQFPLPPEVYAEVQKRIEHRAAAARRDSEDETRLRTGSLPQGEPPRPAPPEGNGDQPGPPPAGEVPGERIKGVGDTLNGRFVLEECLGLGGMGMVYKALDLRKLEASDRNPYIAIKVLNVQFRGHPKSLIALQREAKRAQKLAHPNIVTVYDFDRDGPMVYLTMEFLAGKPLSHLLRAPNFRGLPWNKAKPIVTGICRALAYAHERGFVHCDLKPANVFVTDSGEVKVIDFGIARVFEKPAEETEATVFDPGSLGGLTPAYASPEMIEHREPDPRDDIYALACITYELLAGRHPFNRLPANQARGARLRPQRPPGLGRRQWRTLRGALCFEREGRTPSIARFLREMTGEGRSMPFLAVLGSSLAIAALFSAVLIYFVDFRGGFAGAEPLPAPAAPAAAPAPPPAAVAPPAPAPPPSPAMADVTAVLGQVPCGALHPILQGDRLEVSGFLGTAYGAGRLREQLAALPGVRDLKVDVTPVAADQCEIIQAFAPYWSANRRNGGATSIRTRAPRGELQDGDPLVLNITTPGYATRVQVDYYVLDGSVVHLLPGPRAQDNEAPPDYSATIGSLGNWVVSPPFGQEMIVLLATPAPLFDGPRPESEPRSDYLRAVAARLEQMAREYGPDRITADFVRITTRPRRP